MNQKPIVILVGEPEALGISLVENLLANFCTVKIFSENKSLWLEKLQHISMSQSISVISAADLETARSFDYLLVENHLLNKNKRDLRKLIELAKLNLAKVLFILPYTLESGEKLRILADFRNFALENPDSGVIYVGDIIGPRMVFGDDFVGKTFKDFVENKKIKIPKNEVFIHPLAPSHLAKQIVRSLFSFGPFGQESAYLSQAITLTNFATILQKILPTTSLSYTNEEVERKFVGVKNITVLNFDLENCLKDTQDWFKDHKIERLEKEVVTVRSIPRFKQINLKPLKIKFPEIPAFKILLVILLLILIPCLFLITSGLIFKFSIKEVESGNLSLSKNLILTSRVLSKASGQGFQALSKVPLAGRIFSLGRSWSSYLERAENIGLKTIGILEESEGLVAHILGDSVYDPVSTSESLTLDLDSVYKEASFLQGELGKTKIVDINKLSDFRELVLKAKMISENLPSILGVGKPRTYLVLFQNNMELRPTGGFIGSFGLVTFDNGRLTGVDVQDVYSADGQLRGHIDPPLPIKNYLGEANWYLRDSNWDADFPVSAQRAEWFLDKEIDKTTDGVVAVDLSVARDALKILGPIKLSDFNQVIDDKNLYEKVQYEVESDFFPGSRKKSNFLTALAREFMSEISHPQTENYLSTTKFILKDLQERHIQIFINDPNTQKVISELGFDGAVQIPSCLGNCYSDWLGLIEANLGVNKANYFIKRRPTFKTSFENGELKRSLEVIYENSGSPSLGSKARYKAYLRIMIPQEAVVGNVSIFSSGEVVQTSPDTEEIHGRKEIGTFFEIAAGQKKTVSFSWTQVSNLDFGQKGEYRIYIRKQAGTESDSFGIKLDLPAGVKFNQIPRFSLTQDGSYLYNTNLSRDLFSRIYW